MLPAAASVITQAISVAALGEDRLDRGDVVVGQHDRVGGRARGDAGGVGQAEGGDAGAGRGQQRVDVAVVAAGELHDQRPAGGAAGQPDRRHHRLGAGVDQPHPLDRRHPVDDLLGQLDLALGGRAEGQPAAGGRGHRLDDRGVGVAEDHRPPGADQVDVAPAVGVGEPGARSPAAMNRGVPPTARNARTGLFTPPGVTALRRGRTGRPRPGPRRCRAWCPARSRAPVSPANLRARRGCCRSQAASSAAGSRVGTSTVRPSVSRSGRPVRPRGQRSSRRRAPARRRPRPASTSRRAGARRRRRPAAPARGPTDEASGRRGRPGRSTPGGRTACRPPTTPSTATNASTHTQRRARRRRAATRSSTSRTREERRRSARTAATSRRARRSLVRRAPLTAGSGPPRPPSRSAPCRRRPGGSRSASRGSPARRSTQPLAAAASTIAYSPLTW